MEKVELSERHLGWRSAAALLFLAIGAAFIAYGVVQLLAGDPGWDEIHADGGQEANCGDDFVFLYLLERGDGSLREQRRDVTEAYTLAAREAYRLFHADEGFEGVANVYYINRHPNEEVVVEEPLYRAFALLDGAGDRSLYLAPAYARYDNVFYCADDSQLADYDPLSSDEVREEFARYAAYAGDPDAVGIELLGEGKVRLRVSEEYLAFAREWEIEDFIDFGWMKNAFIVDYLAEALEGAGFTKGSLSSYDGFSRNLYEGAASSFSLYDREGRTIYPMATLDYVGRKSVVFLRDFPLSGQDAAHYYELADGEVRIPYLDPRDGLPRAAEDSLACYSAKEGCATILLRMRPLYVAEELDKEALHGLAAEGIDSVFARDGVIYYTEEGATFGNLYEGEERSYVARSLP